MAIGKQKPILIIHIIRSHLFRLQSVVTHPAIVVQLQRPLGILVVDVTPTGQQIFTVVRLRQSRTRRNGAIIRRADEMVALDRKRIILVAVRLPIGAETEAALPPCIIDLSGGIVTGSHLKLFTINAIVSVVTDFAAVAKTVEKLFLTSTAGHGVDALGVGGFFRNNVDYTVDRVGSP